MTKQVQKIQRKPRKKVTYVPVPLPPEGAVRLPSVAACLGISKNCYIAGEKAGIYPKGRLLTPRVRIYLVSEIRAFLASLENGDTA